MLDNKLIQLIETTSTALDLPNTVIEKDYYVTRIIHALSGIENDYFKLVFAGGTCLAKAHKVVKRMSEDVDFKIQAKQINETFSRTRFLKELKNFRTQIISALTLPDLTIGEKAVRNEGKYWRIDMHYPPLFPVDIALRPHILLEFTLSDIRLTTKNLSVKTLIEDSLITVNALFETPLTQCVSINETAIEKWVGLTRRISAIERNYQYDDETLVRHIYDLNAIKNSNKMNDVFYTLAKVIVNQDAKQFKNQNPEYSNDPSAEIRLSLDLLKTKPLWKSRYEQFINTMVYDRDSALSYEDAINSLENLSDRIIQSFN